MTDYTRDKLIDIAERSVVPHSRWLNRDSSAAQRQAGEALALLRAECRFHVCSDPMQATCTDERTIWIEVTFRGFSAFDADTGMDTETFYLPTEARLKEADGRDWY